MFNKLIFGWLIALAALMSIMTPSVANAAECSLYEQSHPSFLLDGAHLSTGKCGTCASCHRGGVFLGTPKTCIACHNGDPTRVTVGRSQAHPPTLTVDCANCHVTASFTTNWRMDHTAVAAYRCDSCHNGSYVSYNAQTKPANHIPTIMDCTTCHTTANWLVSHADIHRGITTGCVTCHNGVNATGKSNYAPGHPVTSDACETCHSINAEFKCAEAYDAMVNYAQLMLQKVKTIVYSIFA